MCIPVDPQRSSTPQAIMEVAEAVTHARFIGTNSSDDEVVLMRILRVSVSIWPPHPMTLYPIRY